MSCVLGVDVGGTNCKVVRVAEDGTVLERLDFRTDGRGGVHRLVEELAKRIEPWLRGDDAPRALGLAMAGLVDCQGVVREAPNLPDFVGWDIPRELSTRLGGLPVIAENDVNAAAYGELRAGAGRGARNLVMLAMGTGVGGAIVIDGRLYRGSRGVAGELGHLTLQVDGPECACGQPGHVEAYLGTAGIVIHAGGRLDTVDEAQKEPLLAACRQEGELSPRAIAAAAAAGDPLSISILSDVGRLLGLVCANLVNVFNPDLVVVGGGVAGAGDLLLGPARRTLKERAMAAAQQGVRLVTAELGMDAAAVGAGLLALDALDEHGATGP